MNKAKMEWKGRLPTVLDVTIAGHLVDSMDAAIVTDENEITDDENDSENSII